MHIDDDEGIDGGLLLFSEGLSDQFHEVIELFS